MSETTLKQFDHLITQPHGIVLVTGPTGSGKTTTLYAALSRLNISSTNILTVEDPIEYELNGVGQTQVNPRIEMTFAKALRAILRQDPDVIMIGEIRDRASAELAIQAAQTGHLVLSTLHTRNARTALTRLQNLGVDQNSIESCIRSISSQRLVRKICLHCHSESSSQRPICKACNGTGFFGRLGVHEVLNTTHLFNPELTYPTMHAAGMHHVKRGWIKQDALDAEVGACS
jgi:type II secretory ATPase GspE/PulE/Tfp pilus assembly ATPase PilB-like protein